MNINELLENLISELKSTDDNDFFHLTEKYSSSTDYVIDLLSKFNSLDMSVNHTIDFNYTIESTTPHVLMEYFNYKFNKRLRYSNRKEIGVFYENGIKDESITSVSHGVFFGIPRLEPRSFIYDDISDCIEFKELRVAG